MSKSIGFLDFIVLIILNIVAKVTFYFENTKLFGKTFIFNITRTCFPNKIRNFAPMC